MPISDSISRFSSRVENYIRYRPGYPPAILELLKSECGLAPDSVIADIGSGTGKLSEIFLKNGNRVFAVEPNPNMRQAGEKYLAGYPGFISVEGAAEATTLAAQSINFVTAGQAAQWFDPEQARREFVRILKPRGWAVLAWNDRCMQGPFLEEYERLLMTYGTDYEEVSHEHTSARIEGFFPGWTFHERRFPMSQQFDYEGLKGRLLSSSYTPQEGDAKYEPMLAELRRIFAKYKERGRVLFEYETQVFYGQLSA